jgi:hypothetical protein
LSQASKVGSKWEAGIMALRQKIPNYTGPGPVAAQRLDAAPAVSEKPKPRWSKRQTLAFIIAFNVVGWTAAWLVFKSH